MLAPPALAAILAVGVCETTHASPPRPPTLDQTSAALLAVFPLLAAAGSAAGSLVTAPPAPPERRRAIAAAATLGFLAYWLTLTGLALLIAPALIGLSLLIL